MLTLLSLLAMAPASVDLFILMPENAADVLPAGKEVDAVYGDLVLRNEHVTAVIAATVPGRNANLTTRDVGGCLLDFAAHGQPDELTVYRPGTTGDFSATFIGPSDFPNERWPVTFRPTDEGGPLIADMPKGETQFLVGRESLDVIVTQGDREVTYRLQAGSEVLEVLGAGSEDELRVDKSSDWYARADEGEQPWAWTESPWWGAAYGIASRVDDQVRPVQVSHARRATLVRHDEGAVRRLACGLSRLDLARRLTADLAFPQPTASLQVTPPKSPGPSQVDWIVRLAQPAESGTRELATIRLTSQQASQPQTLAVPTGALRISGEALGGVALQPVSLVLREDGQRGSGFAASVSLESSQALFPLRFQTQTADGFPLPAKVAIHRLVEGEEPTDDAGEYRRAIPNFGPTSEVFGVREVQYTLGEPTTVALPRGTYRLHASRGPEYDLTTQEVAVGEGSGEMLHTLTITRAYETPGWMSSDFHSHSTPSGDNTSHQRGRVMNLVCEDIDFAPCTEHQRVDTYQTHIDALGLRGLIVSCTGMELTGSDLPVNHHNVFPLVHKPGEQDGGGPRVGENPDVQVERLALWDDRSEKVIQQNHPTMRRLLRDRDNDQQDDGGYARAVGLIDAIEVHPIEAALALFADGTKLRPGMMKGYNLGRIPGWMDLAAQRRLVGVINTDAHWNHHGSGWTRNWLGVPDDDPATAHVLDLVHATEAGRVIMSNGPFLTMTAQSGDRTAAIGEDLPLTLGENGEATVKVTLEVRCADWLDVDRVGLCTGPVMTHAFYRNVPDLETRAKLFGEGFTEERPLRFRRTFEVTVRETTPLFAVCGDPTRTLGVAAGGDAAAQMPAAMTNAIYVVIDE